MENIKIDDSARLLGKIRLGKDVYVAQGSVLRSVDDSVTIGNRSWKTQSLWEHLIIL